MATIGNCRVFGSPKIFVLPFLPQRHILRNLSLGSQPPTHAVTIDFFILIHDVQP